MKPTVIVKEKYHLSAIIRGEIQLNSNKCNLNHIDVSNLTDMSYLFQGLNFNGDISKWDTSNVKNMCGLFSQSNFNGDISRWDTSNVINMDDMFIQSKFNNDISNWNVSNLIQARYMFYRAEFQKDVSSWKPYCLAQTEHMFLANRIDKPFWYLINDLEERKKVIDTYALQKELSNELEPKNGILEKRMKI
jgi:surface protein